MISEPIAASGEKYEPLWGPRKIVLGNKLATIDLPNHYGFIEEKIAKAIVKKGAGNTAGIVGAIIPDQEASMNGANDYAIICRFEDIGYVKDDDANKLNADEILQSYKEGTKGQNEERKAQGMSPIYVAGWAEKPRYDKKSHEVIWAIQVKEQDSPQAPVTDVNYNTRILGRKGVLSLILVTNPEKLEENKQNIASILTATKFQPGEKYEEYQPGKDKDSGLGLAGLILGGGALAAAAKLGFFGWLSKLLLPIILVGKKFIIVIIAALGAGLAKLFGRKKSQEP